MKFSEIADTAVANVFYCQKCPAVYLLMEPGALKCILHIFDHAQLNFLHQFVSYQPLQVLDINFKMVIL